MKESPNISNFVKPGKASVLFDGQFGSTGKGLAGAWVGENNQVDWCTTNASANAGHTSIIDGKTYVLFHIPSSYLTSRLHRFTRIYINAGAIIDVDVLNKEIEELGINYSEIFVDPNAAVILDTDGQNEKQRSSAATKIASTQKGVGSALARKVLRDGPNLGKYISQSGKKIKFQLRPVSLNRELAEDKSVMVEVPQGFSLGVDAGFYPYCTSRNCHPMQGLSDAGIHPSFFYKSMAVLRTYPIRVGNIMQEGRQIGYSGPVFQDQTERTWEEIGVPPELTTVTKRVRRVFEFSALQYAQMFEHCRPDLVFLNFCNYINNRQKLENIVAAMDQVERRAGKQTLKYYGYGPRSQDIREYLK